MPASRIASNFRYLLYQLMYWYGIVWLYVYLSGDSQVFISYFNLLQLKPLYQILAVLSGAISLWFFLLNQLLTDRLERFLPTRMLVFFKWLIYFGSAFLLMLLAARISVQSLREGNYQDILAQLPELNQSFFRFLVYFYLSGIIYNFFKGMRLRMGRKNFIRWFFGILSKPREEERIFMFIDMKASTTIAEKLFHKKFSYLVQDVFNAMSIFSTYGGEIYQYLGDGAIISWSAQSGILNANCLEAFFAFRQKIAKREKYFQRKYGLKPGFKAGIHVGHVMVLQVGQTRRDISYNGDTLNTTARIEGMCNEFKQDLLISEDLYQRISNKKNYLFKELGSIRLKGKKRDTGVYQVRERKSQSK